jgi:hypothetical protein
MSIDRLIGRLPVAGCQLLRPASRRGGHHGLSQCVAVVLLPGAFPESEGIRGPKCGKSRKILSYSRVFPGIPACSRILGIFFCFLGKIGRRAETATPYRRTNAATEAFARGCFHTGKGAPGAICGGHRPPLQQKVGIPGRKVEFFPAISAFSAFDRLWGIFFYFVKNETESPRRNAKKRPKPLREFRELARIEKTNLYMKQRRDGIWDVVQPSPNFGPEGENVHTQDCRHRGVFAKRTHLRTCGKCCRRGVCVRPGRFRGCKTKPFLLVGSADGAPLPRKLEPRDLVSYI